MQLTRGMRDKLGKYLDCNVPVLVNMKISGAAVYDFCCFGVDAQGKLSDDRYMIFYNQTVSPNQEIRYQALKNEAGFMISLNQLPTTIEKLVFTVSIDGDGVMGNITEHTVSIAQNGTEQLSFRLSGTDFAQEKAIIAIELYRKGEWRINAVGSGFNGGLSALLAAYGGTEIKEDEAATQPTPQTVTANPQPQQVNTGALQTSVQQPVSSGVSFGQQPQTSVQQPVSSGVSFGQQPQTSAQQPVNTGVQQPSAGKVSLKKTEEQLTNEVMGRISLAKDKEKLQSHVVSLSKCVVELSTRNGVDMSDMRAKVVVVIDYSYSMKNLFDNGTIQKTIRRLVPLGLTFDDNGSLDVFLFQSSYSKMDDLTISNYNDYVSSVINKSGYNMGGTCYAPVLNAIIFGDGSKRGGFLGIGGKKEGSIVSDGEPTFVLFITDGENADQGETSNLLVKCSGMNVFIQFIGIGKENFTYLRRLDDLPGRKRDNTGFTKMADLNKADDQELYSKVLDEFSHWLKNMQ